MREIFQIKGHKKLKTQLMEKKYIMEILNKSKLA